MKGRVGCSEKSDWKVVIYWNQGSIMVCEQLFLEQAEKIYNEVIERFESPSDSMEIENVGSNKKLLLNKSHIESIRLKR